MIEKPGKPPTAKESYRPISLLSAIAKLFEKKPHLDVPNFQFRFRLQRATAEQIQRIVANIERALEGKKVLYCNLHQPLT